MSGEIWLVSSGSYSDYSIFCAAPSEEEAGKIAAKMNDKEKNRWDDYEVESFPLVTSDELVYREYLVLSSHNQWAAKPPRPAHEREWSRMGWEFGKPTCEVIGTGGVQEDGSYSLTVQGSDIERVRKVYAEKIAEIVARLNLIA